MKNFVLIMSVVSLFSRTPKDSEIKEATVVNAKEELVFVGVNNNFNKVS